MDIFGEPLLSLSHYYEWISILKKKKACIFKWMLFPSKAASGETSHSNHARNAMNSFWGTVFKINVSFLEYPQP